MEKCVDCGKPVVPGQHSRFVPDLQVWDPLCDDCALKPLYEEAERRLAHENEKRNVNHEEWYAVLCDTH